MVHDADCKIWVLRNVPYVETEPCVEDRYCESDADLRQCVNLYLPLHRWPAADAEHLQNRLLHHISCTWSHQYPTLPTTTPSRSVPPVCDKVPILFYVHGGAWLSGSRHVDNAHEMLKALCRNLGCVGVSVGYRLCRLRSRSLEMLLLFMALVSFSSVLLVPKECAWRRLTWLAMALFFLVLLIVAQVLRAYSPHNAHPTSVQDVALAARWVHEHAPLMGGDPRRVILMGHSAGAHLVTGLYASPDYWHQTGIPRHHVSAIVAVSGLYSAKYMRSEWTTRGLGRVVFGEDEHRWSDDFATELIQRYHVDRCWPPTLILSAEFDYGLRLHARDFYRALIRYCHCLALEWVTVRDVDHFSITCFWNYQHHRIADIVCRFLMNAHARPSDSRPVCRHEPGFSMAGRFSP